MDANDRLSIQVHPDDSYAAVYEKGKLGKTEFWYILDVEPGASIVHGFKTATSSIEVRKAIEKGILNELLHEEPVSPGDIIFVPAGIVHSISGGVLFYELEEYSDVTYRLYDHGRLTVAGTPRKLNIERALAVSHLQKSPFIKMQPVLLSEGREYEERCLVACRHFVSCEIILQQSANALGYKKGKTAGSCIILTSLDAEGQVRYGNSFELSERLALGQTVVLPATLGNYCIEGAGRLILSYVPSRGDEAWRAWEAKNGL
jgi:mannose-6-phosphate isomerase